MMIVTACVLGGSAPAQSGGSDAPENPNPQWDDGWIEAESAFLSGHRQLTFRDDFIKAGESYFSPDGDMVIFQAIEPPADGEDPSPHYGMYVAPVARDNDNRIVGLGDATRISSEVSANTCGWFHPSDFLTGRRYRVLFGTTRTAPERDGSSGYQRGTSRYSWQFPNEMEIVEGDVRIERSTETVKVERKVLGITRMVKREVPRFEIAAGAFEPIWERAGYDAEGSWSPDGRHILYTRLEPGSDDGDIWIYDTERGTHTELVAEPGYDGGPFFSPDGRSICYRSDRRGDKLLQIFVSRLAFDDGGAVVGIEEEIQITDNEHVNWAPFFTRDGEYLFYASSEVSHGNYEVFCVSAEGDAPPAERPTLRITTARGFDGLPVFSPDGETMMWTAQRGALAEAESRPSSQLWVADVDLEAVDAAYRAARGADRDESLDEAFESYTPPGVEP